MDCFQHLGVRDNNRRFVRSEVAYVDYSLEENTGPVYRTATLIVTGKHFRVR